MIEELEEHTEADTFTKAVNGYFLGGEPLRKYSMSRKNAADSMGIIFPLLDEARQTALETNGRYAGMKRDVCVILWLCSIKDTSELSRDEQKARAWTPERAFANPAGAIEEAMRWAETQPWGGDYNEAFAEAARTMFAIVMGVELSVFDVHTDDSEPGEKKEENSSQPPGLL